MTTNKLMVDVNIFEDVIRKRKGWEDSQKILNLVDSGEIEGWISSLTRVIIYFLSVRRIGESKAREIVSDLTHGFSEIPLRSGIGERALKSQMPEYEDNIQLESALQFHLSAVITRNKKHYQQSSIPVFSPDEFLTLLEKKSDSDLTSIPFLDLKAQHHQVYNEIDDRITDIIANTGFILGKHVDEFEERFAELQGAKFCLGVSSGTDALHVALLALGIEPGDEVIVPVNTFIATAEAVSLSGAVPVFVDCDEYYNLDVQKLKGLLDSRQGPGNDRQKSEVSRQEWGGGIKAIVPVHLYGQPANMDEIAALAEEFGLSIVEDCCQAHLAEWHGGKVGNFSEFGAFSFYPGKNLGAYGEAGALVTNDEELYIKAKMIRQHGEIERYHHNVIGHNYRMEAVQGAVLSTKLKFLDEWTKKRQKNAQLYNELLEMVKGVHTPKIIDRASSVFHLYVIQSDDREGLQNYLQKNGIATGLHYPVPLHLQDAYTDLGYREGDFPVAEKAARRILSLPMFPELTERQIRYVCDKINEYMKRVK